MCPPPPDDASPVSSCTWPVWPLLDVPVSRVTDPLTPLLPAFAVFTRIEPLEVDVPLPDVILTAPPRPAYAAPPRSSTLPPLSSALAPFASPPLISTTPPSPPSWMWLLDPSPAAMLTRPPDCAVAVVRPATIEMSPPS